MTEVIVSPEAQSDFHDIIDHIAQGWRCRCGALRLSV
jgi:plasmid stabilization system protein ParE